MKKYPSKERTLYATGFTSEMIEAFKKANTRIFDFGACSVMVSDSEPGSGWHLSISNPYRLPTWDEVKAARYTFLPKDKTFAMLLPPESEYVNLHSYCFHLYEHLPIK